MARPNASTRAAFQRGGFSKGLADFHRKIEAFSVDLLPEVGRLMHESITVGSQLTGAPGQPFEQGDLTRSYIVSHPTPTSVQVSSDSVYARMNEDGLRAGGKPYVQRSARGGRHSVRLTRLGMQRLVNAAAHRVAERGRQVA